MLLRRRRPPRAEAASLRRLARVDSLRQLRSVGNVVHIAGFAERVHLLVNVLPVGLSLHSRSGQLA